MPTQTRSKSQPSSEHHERAQGRISVPESGSLPDTVRTISMIAGGATAGAVVAGPIGAIVGGIAGAGVGLNATGHLFARS